MKHSLSKLVGRGLLRSGLVVVCLAGVSEGQAQTNRVLGLDISAWQGNISQATWNNLYSVENRQFVVLRSSRGGTTGFYNQNDSDNSDGLNTFSQRYDDPYFVQNMNRAAASGMLVGTYHFSRPDVIATTLNSGGIPNSGTDEADHFIQMAGAFMRPGYLPPVHDFEAGAGARTSEAMAQFCLDFSDRIYEKLGIRPAIYTSGNYAGILGGASAGLRDLIAKPSTNQPSMVSPAYPILWSARWPNQADPNSIDVDNTEPKDTYAPIYGPWDDYGTTHPWILWQYASTMRLQSFNNGGNNLDVDCARGGIEYLKDYLIPAVWTHDGNGNWLTLTNWNSGLPPIVPVPGPGQGTPIGTQTLPTPRLPTANDTLILERPNTNITVTYFSLTNNNIRKLYVREKLDIIGGPLTVNYTPSWDSTTNAAQFSSPVLLSNATFNVHTLQVDAAQTFTLSNNANLKLHRLSLMPGTTPATLALHGNVTLGAWSNGVAAKVVSGAGTGSTGRIDLGGGDRILTVTNGADVAFELPVQNGAVTKGGPGILRLTAANTYPGGTVINAGRLYVSNPTGSGTGTGNVRVNSGSVLRGTGRISGTVSNLSGATLAPGDDTDFGTLTLASAPVLSGETRLRVDRNGGSPEADRLALTAGTLTFNGLLTVTNVGPVLSGGEVFTLFSAAAYGGQFISMDLPVLNAGLNWYKDELPVNGTLRVNRRPTANWVAFNSTPGQTLVIAKASLLAAGADLDGDVLALSDFTVTTTNGIALTADATNIYYLNPADVPDRFGFTLNDGHGGIISAMVLIGQGLPTLPSIQTLSGSLTVLAGQNATFTVGATGSGPLSYQWRFNGTNLAGATTTAYTRAGAQTNHAGAYTVVVTNTQGSVTSAVAALTVVLPVSITAQPQGTNTFSGQNLTLTVGASGTAPFSYQWYFQGNPLGGASASGLVLTNLATNQAGSYYAIVGNGYSAATSQVASVTVVRSGLLQVLWKLAPYARPYLTTNDLPEQRGMAYNPVTRRLLVVHRMTTTIYVLNADTGADLWTLNTSGVTGGLNTGYYLLLATAADDGAIYACNLKASTSPFKIYRWANDNSNTVPTVAYSGDPFVQTPALRWGDTFEVRGSGTNTQILLGPRIGTNVVLFTTANGLDFTPRSLALNGIPEANCGLSLTFGYSNTFWGTTHTNPLRLVSYNAPAGTASTQRLYSEAEVPSAINPLGFSPELNMLAGVYVNSPTHLRVYDLNPANGVPLLLGSTNFPADNSNTHTGTGAVRFGGDTIYALNANNGLMAVRVLLPNSPLRFAEASTRPGQPFVLRGTGGVGNYVVEGTSTPFTGWTPLTNITIGISGTFEYTEAMTNTTAQRFYRVRKL